MNEIRDMLVEAATRLFTEQVDGKVLDAAKREGWSSELWRVLEDAQMTRVGTPEEGGGAGGTVSDLAAVLRLAGHHAAPVPLADTAMLANWLLSGAGVALPDGPLTAFSSDELAVTRTSGGLRISGTVRRVPFARIAAHLVVLAPCDAKPQVLLVPRTACVVTAGSNLAGEPRDVVQFNDVLVEQHAPAAAGVDADAFRLRGALSRALLMAGALERTLAIAVSYAQERVQFGRKIGQFQALQQELARAAGEASAGVAAALSAAGVLERGGDAALAIAAAKARTAEAARDVAAIAHQVHGAIGVSDEYVLHHLTLRLWAWREEFGNEVHWAQRLGARLAAAGADALWPSLSAN